MEALGLFILWLLGSRRNGAATAPATSPAATPAKAADMAKQAADAAATNPTPANLAKSADIAQKAADVAKVKAVQATAAQKQPPPWPSIMPAGLPPFPAGWEADNPPPKEVVARAWQLLPVMWKHGAGTRTTEFVGGRWITFVAQMHSAGKKGVTAFRVRGASKAA